ncbi:unnamed protein product, partial [Acanthocheilonema viteae]
MERIGYLVFMVGNIIAIFKMSAPEEQLDIFSVWDYLRREPAMLHVLQEYINERMQVEIALQTRLEEAGRRIAELEGRNAQEMDEEPASQEPEWD